MPKRALVVGFITLLFAAAHADESTDGIDWNAPHDAAASAAAEATRALKAGRVVVVVD